MIARPSRSRGFEAALAASAAALLALAFLFAATGVPDWIPPAPLVRAGIASPLSGMTRSFVAVARGDVAGGFAWHPLGPVCFAACIATVAVVVTGWWGARWPRLRAFLAKRTVWAGVGVAIALAWIRQILVLEI